MNINTKNIVSITEANQNFSKVARLVDENGAAVRRRNNAPRYLGLARAEYRQGKPAGYFPAADHQEPQGFQGYGHLKPYLLV